MWKIVIIVGVLVAAWCSEMTEVAGAEKNPVICGATQKIQTDLLKQLKVIPTLFTCNSRLTCGFVIEGMNKIRSEYMVSFDKVGTDELEMHDRNCGTHAAVLHNLLWVEYMQKLEEHTGSYR